MHDESPEPVYIPYEELEPDTLRAVVESFVLREGTDYGSVELSLEAKVARLSGQLRSGVAKILFDPDSQSITIVPGPTSRP